MKNLIDDIRKYGFLHGINASVLRFSLRRAYSDEKKEAVLEAYAENEEMINDFYTKFIKYF